ncbi:MAG: hypothetical protein NT070_18945 [Cyanobacteria bacterium]|nr:hypothetical protein [Cyanobacteriota bacterium]
MNMAPPLVVRSNRSNAEPTRILLIGTRDGIQETIDHLCVLNLRPLSLEQNSTASRQARRLPQHHDQMAYVGLQRNQD